MGVVTTFMLRLFVPREFDMELRASRISYLITNLVRKMKSTTCLHFKSLLSKRGVERAKLYLEDKTAKRNKK